MVMFFVIIFIKFNELGKIYGIGCFDLFENCFVGMKFRGIYEIFGGIIFFIVYCGMEEIIFDKGVVYFKDEIMLKYVEFIYNGFWFVFEREMF